ncbi:hypothetical protein EDB89DRAFT_144722 [Lactarius sanguifluus]|nr:hypothetical protein EDB89DRAFT_144722 [Lactarius sanguifluus]
MSGVGLRSRPLFAFFPLSRSALSTDTPSPAGPQAMLIWACGNEELRPWSEVWTLPHYSRSQDDRRTGPSLSD